VITSKRLTSEHDLVHYAKPPVSEVSLTAQFSRGVVDLEVLAAFRQAMRPEFPGYEQQPALPPMVESFDQPPQAPTFQVEFNPPSALPRTWFLTGDGTRLLQLQSDRVSLNWRRLEGDAEYPRYSRLRADFERCVRELFRCVNVAGAAEPRLNLVEVTYVNPVQLPDASGLTTHPDLGRIVNRVGHGSADPFLPTPEDAQLQARWRIPGDALGVSGPAGRLHFAATPALGSPQGTPLYVLTLTARVMPAAEELEAGLLALDVGHRWVVLSFDDLTSPEMHDLWQRSTPG
jgi:uncharacterized protein (TIGR04255 family)